MIKKNDETGTLRVKKVSRINNMALGYNEEEFVIAINHKSNEVYEGAYTIPADKLRKVVSILFGAGVDYQRKTGIDIGFGIGDNCDENAE